MSSKLSIVAPSFEIVVSFLVVIILSMPLGPTSPQKIPRVVLTISTMASIALTLEMICPIPSLESVPSRSSKIVGCWVKKELLASGSFFL